MKHLKVFAAMLTIAALSTGCTKEYITEEYITEEHYNGPQMLTHTYTVNANDWERREGDIKPGEDNYLYATFNNSDITADVEKNGTVVAEVWSIYNQEKNLGAWCPLPYAYPLMVEVKDEDGNTSTMIVPENIRFEWETGLVTFIIQDLDGFDPLEMNSSLTFRVTVFKD